MLLVWMCSHCKWITVSDQVPHRMDACKCGKTSVDFEQCYTRVSGEPYVLIALVNGDTGEIEIAGNLKEQS